MITTTKNKISYVSDGIATSYDFNFPVAESSDIQVYIYDLNNNKTQLVYGTDYAVSLNSDNSGGTVTLTNSVNKDYAVLIYREVPYTQETVYEENSPFPAKSHEKALDKLTLLSQQLQEKFNRTLQYDLADEEQSVILPPMVGGGFLGTTPDKKLTWKANVNYSNINLKVNTISDLLNVDLTNWDGVQPFVVLVLGYHEPNDGGGGVFYWDANESKANHNGGMIIDPEKAFPTDWSDTSQQDTWFNTTNTGNGCWIRQYERAVYVDWFGAKGDGVTDDTNAIQKALSFFDNVLLLNKFYSISATINILAGKHIKGIGMGKNPLDLPVNGKGSVLSYTGNDVAVSINGYLASIQDVCIYDYNKNATIGLLINGDGTTIESVYTDNVLIYGFENGIGQKLIGINNGSAAYCKFSNLRIRDCKICVEIEDAGGASGFVNTNQWIGGAFSAGNFDYGIHVIGGDNNKFIGTSVEATTVNIGGIVVETGSIEFNGRLEITTISDSIPIVNLYSGTSENKIGGYGGNGIIIDKGTNNYIFFSSAKAPQPYYISSNLLGNASFNRVTATSVDKWNIYGSMTFSSSENSKWDGVNTLIITVPANSFVYLYQNLNPDMVSGKRISIGSYVKCSDPNVVTQWSIYDGNTSVGSPHIGDGSEYWIGHSEYIDSSATVVQVRLFVNNTTGASINVEVTLPVCSIGELLPFPTPKLLHSGKAVMDGLFATSFGTSATANDPLVLSRDGNIFRVSGTGTITRINDTVDVRFPKGSIITLIFDDNVTLTSGAYLLLKGDFTSSAGNNSNITLVSNGDGTWIELARSA